MEFRTNKKTGKRYPLRHHGVKMDRGMPKMSKWKTVNQLPKIRTNPFSNPYMNIKVGDRFRWEYSQGQYRYGTVMGKVRYEGIAGGAGNVAKVKWDDTKTIEDFIINRIGLEILRK